MAIRLRIKRVPELRERDVSGQIIDFLKAQRWTCIRTNSGLFQRPGSSSRIKIGKTGDPDWICLKAPRLSTRLSPWVWCFYLELKRPGKKPSPEQLERHEELRRDGFEVIVADCWENFHAWFKSTGYEL